MKMRWVQTISRKGQWEPWIWRAEREVRGRARLQSCRRGGKTLGALASEVALLILLESSETICQIPMQIGKDRVRTAWRHAESGRNVHSTSRSQCVRKSGPQRLKPDEGRLLTARLEAAPFQISLDPEGVTELSEIPCRVSSDLHEWRNESATVLPTDTANL